MFCFSFSAAGKKTTTQPLHPHPNHLYSRYPWVKHSPSIPSNISSGGMVEQSEKLNGFFLKRMTFSNPSSPCLGYNKNNASGWFCFGNVSINSSVRDNICSFKSTIQLDVLASISFEVCKGGNQAHRYKIHGGEDCSDVFFCNNIREDIQNMVMCKRRCHLKDANMRG